jgi:hypothetical protein
MRMPLGWKLVCLATLTVSQSGANASTPTGRHFGVWHVTSISSMSGVDPDDAADVLVQETEIGRLQASWYQPGRVAIEMRIDDCYGEGDELDYGYSVELDRWLRQTDGGGARLRADFATWLAQARLACREAINLNLFQLDRLDEAATEFSVRLRYLSGSE